MNVSAVAARMLLVAIVCATRVALAAPPSSTEADARRAEGIEAFRRQDYEAARVAFAQSYAIAPRTATLLSLAIAELNSGHPLEAARHLRQYIRASDAPADKVEEVRRKMLPKAEAQLGRLQVEAPSGARIFVDGNDVGAMPLAEPIDVMPGSHEVAVDVGGRTNKVQVLAAAGQVSRVRVEIANDKTAEPAPVAPASSMATLTTPERVDTTSSWSTPKTVFVISAAAAAVVSAAVGVYFSLQSGSAASDADALRPVVSSARGYCYLPPPERQGICDRFAEDLAVYPRDRNLATGFYVGAGILAVGAVAAWLLWPSKTGTAPRAQLIPMIEGARGASGFHLVGSF